MRGGSLTTRVLAGLLTGGVVGLVLAARPGPTTDAVLGVLAPVGTIFINLIRMTVVPLVASMLVASVGSLASSGLLQRATVRLAALSVGLLAVTTVGTIAVAAPLFLRIPIDEHAALALHGSGAGVTAAATAASPGLAGWLVDLVPPNVVKAAADGATLPVIVFSVLFGVALSRAIPERRAVLVGLAQDVAAVMQRLVSGILSLAPLGVFALAVPLAARLGLTAAAAVAGYIALVVGLTVLLGALLLYPIGIVGGGMAPRAFVEFCAPAQAVAFASRSSLAALPAMVESSERAGQPPVISGFVLPLSASAFRVGAAVAMPVGVLFLARLYGLTLSTAQLTTVGVSVVLTTFAVPGIPGGSVIAMVPVLAAVNLPVDGIGILLAVDAIPDMFRTTANVTGSLALAAVLRRRL